MHTSQGIADAQQQNAARTEISSYVVQMSEMDRTGGSGRRNEIVTLARQVDALVSQYGQRRLNISASTYRLIGLFLALSTTDLELAARMANRALELAAHETIDGAGIPRMNDPLEALQAHRVLGDVAAQNLNFDTMTKEYEAALEISEREGKRNRYIAMEARRYTRAYWSLSAIMLVDDLPHPTNAECSEVRRRTELARADFDALKRNPEIARRARRIENDVCAAGVDLSELKKD
ncbi:hypothetical protein ACFXA3_25495 [Streptomyces sp. NPDC059456]|uniref:hypothetical protein n=1 Tax=Streptomyces sp. NPDC059456 TaxID=3346838 RepID=UPI0036C0A1F6